MRHLLILACLLFGTGAVADEADFDFKSKKAKAAVQKYQDASRKSNKRNLDSLIRSLEAAFKHERTEGDFEEAIKIRDTIKALEKGAERKGKAETERTIKVGHWPNGQKRSETQFKDGKKDGLETWWHSNSQMWMERPYKNGKRDDLWTRWFWTGQKEWECHYKDGKKDGLETWWHDNGQKQWEIHYKNGEQDGLSIGWGGDGRKHWESHYKNGKEVSRKEF